MAAVGHLGMTALSRVTLASAGLSCSNLEWTICPECRMFYSDLSCFKRSSGLSDLEGSTSYRSSTILTNKHENAGLPQTKLILAILSRRMIIT